MKISVITVCYNSEKTIEQTIQSVISQKYDDLEYIIIDGGSTDRTLDIIDRYRNNISVFISEPDNGLYDAMNKGMNLMSGDIFAFLNSDDWYAPGTLKKVNYYFEKNDTCMVSGNIFLHNNGENKKLVLDRSNKEDVFLRLVYPHPALFSRKEVYMRVGGFNTKYRIAADVDWVMRVCSSGYKVLCVDDYFTYFREGGLSSEKRYESLIEQYHAAIQCIQKYHKEYLREKIDEDYNLVLPCVEKEELIKNAFEEHLDEIKELFDEGEYYIWGTGAMAKNCLGIFEKLNIPVAGFIDSYKKQERFENYQVISPDEIDINGYICISSVKYEKEIIDVIKSIGIDESRYFTYAYLMEQIERKGCLEIEEDIILHG